MKRLILAALAVALCASPALAAEKLKFAVVPKAMNNPFFDVARDGCIKRAQELGNVECIYKGPIEHEPATQVQIIQDLITQKVDGLAISVSDAGAAEGVIKSARDAGIPVVTFDSDAPASARQAYIGTDNKESGGPAATNLNERLDGVREVVNAAGWKEVAGSPTYCNDDLALAVQQLSDLTTAHPDLNALVAIGGWALFVPEGYKGFVTSVGDRFKKGDLVILSADTLPVEIDLLKGGYVNELVGQRPGEMGAKAIDTLLALHNGQKVDEIIHTGLDFVNKDNAAKF
jgi:ribose transport system substrate-binding protein